MKLFVIIAFLLSLDAFADEASPPLPLTTHGFTAGPSVPTNTGYEPSQEPDGISRVHGGEHLVLDFKSPQVVNDVKITGYSTSRKGTVLIRSLRASLKGKVCPADLKSIFGKSVGDAQSLSVSPSCALDKIDLQAEGFKNDDASLVLEWTSPDANKVAYLTRHRPSPPPPPDDSRGSGASCYNGGQWGMCLDGSLCCTGGYCDDASTCTPTN